MKAARTYALLLLPAFALLLLGAHFFRATLVPLTVACLGLVGLLFVRAPWAARALQVVLALGTLEWLRTAWVFASARAGFGQPYGRLLLILGAVALVTALAAVVLRTRTAREHFRVGG
ncbi:MAG: hypothetical protein NDI84_02130 [Steroidobacteraceae bacterium]|nr:hypothetical protein [Steroidobacteraceae bacterium]